MRTLVLAARAGWRRIALPAVLASILALAAIYGSAVARRAAFVAPPATPILYDRQGLFLAQLGNGGGALGPPTLDYGYWPVERVPPRIAAATLALEDRRFWSHPGVDLWALGRAAGQDLRHLRRISGASTLAMQLARMQQPGPRTLWTKAVEAGAALVLTARYGREAILAQYLRLVPYGNGSHGIGHAARFYFDKPVEDLSWAEIALLAAIPQSPTRMNPLHADGLRRAVRRGHRMLDELGRQGVLPSPELSLAHAQLDALRPPARPRRPEALHALLRYDGMWRRGELPLADPADPRVVTTLDLDIQSRVEAATRRALAGWRGQGAQQAAVMVVERHSRAVLAVMGSGGYAAGQGGAIDFTRVPRSPGSTLKPFLYALALERGVIRSSDILPDLPEGSSGIGNADGAYLGPMLPRQALANSRNVPAANLLRLVGLDTFYRFLRGLGLDDVDRPPESLGLSLAIGALPTTLERIMRAYGVLAEDGLVGDLVWYRDQHPATPRPVLSEDSARLVTLFLADPMARLPSFTRYGATDYPFPVALKTGTSQGYRDAWFVGWSGRYIVGVWVGRGDAGTMVKLSGSRSAARLGQAILLDLHHAVPGELSETGFPPPDGRVPVELCAFGGKRNAEPCGQTLTEWVRPDEMPPIEQAAVVRHAPEGDRLAIVLPAAQRGWAREEGLPLDEGPAAPGTAARLVIASPEPNSRLWRNPDAPAAANRLALKATVEPRVPQIVWYVDGQPFATTDPDRPVFWPMTAGEHRFQVRLPLQDGASRAVRIIVQ